ncbi:MAG: right-handed parallel beta-helix repeat-containing protein [Oscillatoriales cyanobacterium C42_A2020_001]|nr:right-handed parallel beta-helix repeat-containing protein [Leptolyngbyaceae cyanobacterium C42_A2020_001]
MRQRFWWMVGSVLGSVAISAPVNSQTLVQSPPNPEPVLSSPESTKASDLLIPARAGAGYSTSGGGYDGFGSFEGFIPLRQTPGKDLLYLVGRLLLDNDANLGGNLLLGYRFYNPKANLIYGGYLGYDSRSTGESVFSQLGLGFEALGDGWDARINGYIPVGNTRQTVAERLFDTGAQLNNFRFESNFLRASGTRQQQLIRNVEVAMAGFDAEAGGRLFRFGNGGDLRGYAGLYYLSGGENSFGVRGRLEARPLDYLTLGVAVQHDSIFGTNVVGTVALTFPSSRPKGVSPTSVQARMGEMPYRINAIAVDTRTEVEFSSSAFVDVILTNPATGQPYFFQHVTLGAAGGNGTFENPFGLVQSALSATRSNGNDIVYVQAGTNPGIPAFTIPDRVQVLSTGVVQQVPALISGQLFPPYQLPLSGSGTLPNVNGTVTMGSDTVLSGFNITSTTGAGVTFSNVSRVEIRDNIIRNTASTGIAGNGFTTANLFRNQITATGAQGISLQSGGTATITDSRVTNTQGAGVAFTSVTNTEIRDTVIQNTGDAGILGNGATSLTLLRNDISSARNQGVYVQNVGTSTVTDNRITGTIAGTTTIANPITGDITIGSITIPNPGSIIPLPSGQGIVIATTTGNTNIARNTITGTGTQGIVLLNASGNAAITDNTVANTVGALFPVTVPTIGTFQVPTGQGIVVAGVNGNLDINRNTLNALNGQGIAIAGTTNGTTTISNNTIRNATDQGLLLAATTGTTNITNNQISDLSARLVSATIPVLGTVTFSTGQGLALLNSVGTVNVTGNTIERVAGAYLPTVPPSLPAFPGGQGIQAANFAGQLDLNILNNQIRTNDNDGILMLFAGRPSGSTTAASANVRIANNTIENNGGATPIRGDGIAIAVEQDATVNNLTIESNTIRGNGDEGIDIRLGLLTVPLVNPTTARLTGAIRNNTISGNGQNGIQVQATASTNAKVDIISNTSSGNGQRGIYVTTTNTNSLGIPTLGNPTISANIQTNTLTTNTLQGIDVATTAQPLLQTICVNLAGNISTNPSTITNTFFIPGFVPNVLAVVNLAGVNAANVGGVIPSVTPPPTNTVACP